jgi:hypothetical protein
MAGVTPLADIAPAFVEMAHRIVWCTVATTDPDHRPRTRILHPLWEWDGERLVGWVATGPTPTKRAALETSPHVSLTYWDPSHDTATADCAATWAFDDATRIATWERFVHAPAPVGYDPAIIPPWKDGPTSDAFAALRLDPVRLRVMPGTVMLEGKGEPLTWRSPQA